MTEAQKAALRSFWRFVQCKTLAEVLEAEALLDQAKTLYADIWSPSLQQHWRSAKARLGRMRNRLALREGRHGTAEAPKPPPLINAQSFAVRTAAVGLNIGVSMAVVERRFVGSDHVVLSEVLLIIDGVEIVMPAETYKHPTFARAIRTLSRAPFADSLGASAGEPKTAQFRSRVA